MSQLSPGARLRAAVAAERPLQVVGAINAYAARMAEACGFNALYLSGGGVAANSLGLPIWVSAPWMMCLRISAALRMHAQLLCWSTGTRGGAERSILLAPSNHSSSSARPVCISRIRSSPNAVATGPADYHAYEARLDELFAGSKRK